jgi:hypothetical protein
VSTACALVALSTLALAQPANVECRSTETQAECHARLKCKANEELEDCKKRLGAQPRQQDDTGRDRDPDQTTRDRDPDDGGRRDRDDRASDDDTRSRRQRGGRGGEGGRRRRDGGGNGSAADKTFGLGLEAGEPSGLNGKYFLSDSGALDFGVGWIYQHYYYGDGVHLYADYLWHPRLLASTSTFELPFYIGLGVRFWDFEYCDNRVCGFDGSALGFRVPFGIAFDFNNAPLDIFLQLVPVLDFIDGDYYDRFGDRMHFGIDGTVGIRFWFK